MVNPSHSSRASTSSHASEPSETSESKAKDTFYSKIRKFHHSKYHHHHVKDGGQPSSGQIDIETIPMEDDENPASTSPSVQTVAVANTSSEGINLSSPTPHNSEVVVVGKPSKTLERLIAMDKEQERRTNQLTAIMLNIQKLIEKNDRKDPREEEDRGLRVPQGQLVNTRNADFPTTRGGIHNMSVKWPENFGPRSYRLRFLTTLTKLMAYTLHYLALTHLLPCQTDYELCRSIARTVKPSTPTARPPPSVIEPVWDDDEGMSGAKLKRLSNIRVRTLGAARVRNS